MAGREQRPRDRSAAAQQITAEHIIRAAKEGQEAEFKAPKRVLHDQQEVDQFRAEKRKFFEFHVLNTRGNIPLWQRYATFEEEQGEFRRARSIYERAIEVDFRHPSLWQRYADMELRHRFVNQARNVLDRAVTLLPRVNALWYKYVHMEEVLGNIAGARAVFDRWLAWEPSADVWRAAVRLNLRYGETAAARDIYTRYVRVVGTLDAWLAFAQFEQDIGDVPRARAVFELAVEALESDEDAMPRVFQAFADFEENAKEYERARVIYRYALDHVVKRHVDDLYKVYAAFEKRHGTRDDIEDVIVKKRRYEYEALVAADPRDYDTWFEFIRLEQQAGAPAEAVIRVFDRAIANPPPVQRKAMWRRFIYLYINYAVWAELDAKDMHKAREVWTAALAAVPHKAFTFAKLWLAAAHFELRDGGRIDVARRLLGRGIGRAPKNKLFRGYIELEQQLGETERCRTLFGKWLEFQPSNVDAWIRFADFEADLGEWERARALYDLAVDQPVLDAPERLWKSYIDMEVDAGDPARARALYERLLEHTQHVKVWISYAQFEARFNELERARAVFNRAFDGMKGMSEKMERVVLHQAWVEFERALGNAESLQQVQEKAPQQVRKRRVNHETGEQEEYLEYVFPDESAAPNLKLLEMARAWKAKQQQQQQQQAQ